MDHLQRQRALLQEHLRWLESEIAAEASSDRTRPSAVRPPPALEDQASRAPVFRPSPSDSPTLDVPEPNVRGIHNEVRSGCLLYFGLAFLVAGAAVAFIYWRY